jgi:hypothetical protein
MKTKTQIVQELLDKKAITAEEAVTLLEKEINYWPHVPYQPQPYSPTLPFNPMYPTVWY